MIMRRFQEADNICVKELVSAIFFKEFPLSRKAYQIDDLDCISKSYSGARDIFFVVEEDNKIVGTAGIKEDTKQAALLRRIYVHPACRGKGYGAKLVDAAVDFCRKNQYRQIVFRTTDQMKEAMALCLKKGFLEDERLNLGDIQIIKFILKI